MRSDIHPGDAVIHLAALGSAVDSVADPAPNMDVNIGGTLNMLQAAVAAGASRFILASTGGALIGDAIPPVTEQSLPHPISPYGASKLSCEAYCHAFAASAGLATTCLRFGNVYGSHSIHKGEALLLGRPVLLPPGISEFEEADPQRVLATINSQSIFQGLRGLLDRPTASAYPIARHEAATVVAATATLYQQLAMDRSPT